VGACDVPARQWVSLPGRRGKRAEQSTPLKKRDACRRTFPLGTFRSPSDSMQSVVHCPPVTGGAGRALCSDRRQPGREKIALNLVPVARRPPRYPIGASPLLTREKYGQDQHSGHCVRAHFVRRVSMRHADAGVTLRRKKNWGVVGVRP